VNKLWIEDSHVEAASSRRGLQFGGVELTRIKYLDIMGLFETCWMTYGFEMQHEYGYPGEHPK